MRHLIIRICCFLLIISSIGIITPQTAHAAIDLTQVSRCSLGNMQYVWNGSAQIHPNGLLYVSRTVAPPEYAKTNGYIAIYAINPNAATEGICPIVASYLDTVNDFSSISVPHNSSVMAKDSQGNLYIGKSTRDAYRLLFIPNSATASRPFDGIVIHNVIYSTIKKEFSLFSALGITDSHAMIGMNSWNNGDSISADYTIVPTAAIKDNSTPIISNATWNSFGQVTFGFMDSITGMPDGRFFASILLSSPKMLGAAFINPINGTVINAISPSSTGIGAVSCQAQNLHFSNPAYCGYPTATIGLDNNLYFLAYADGYTAKSMVAMRYDTKIKSWSGIGNLTAITEISAFNNKEPTVGGGKITADADGNVVVAINSRDINEYPARYYTTLAFLNKKTNNWTVLVPNVNSVGKPDINFILTGGSPRISVITSINGVLWWTTYTGPINIASTLCSPNVVVEGGSYYINKTSVSGTIYTADTCKATRYYAIKSTNATPVDPSDSSPLIKPFSPDNANFSVSELVQGLNYIHVRLYDKTTAMEKWVTNSVYVDTNATVQASVTLQNGNSASNFKDTWSMRASSYTASAYTRSSIGTIRVTGITDPSGLASYAINDQPAVNFDISNINKPIPVNFNSITSTVGISLTLTDGAGNTEIRGIRPLTYDVEPPSISGDLTPAFTATPGVFSGTIGLTGGTITDDLYSASGRQYWGVWVANAKCVGDVVGGCPADTASQLRWGAVPVSDPTSIPWNLLHGLNQAPSSGLYRTYIRVLDGAGNASTTAVTVDTTVTMTTNKIYMPLNFSQR